MMMKHESLARQLKDEGNNCSASLHGAFFGFNKCRDLIKNGRNCREYVGQTAQMIDKIISH